MNLKNLLDSIILIIEKTGQVLLKNQVRTKETDVLSDSMITKQLQALTPDIPIYSEEREKKIGQTFWMVDPIDGSFNYYHYDPFWSISIGLVKNKQTQLGVVYLPSFGWLVGVTKENYIVKGNIALGLSLDKNLSAAMVWMDWDKQGILTPLCFSKIGKDGIVRIQVRQCCSASLVAVATGRISAFIHPGPNPEDISAGGLIVEKAGGKVTDFDGNPWTPFSKSIIATNGQLHEELLKILP